MWPLKREEARSWGQHCDQHGKALDRKKEAGLAEQHQRRVEGPNAVTSAVRRRMRMWTPLR